MLCLAISCACPVFFLFFSFQCPNPPSLLPLSVYGTVQYCRSTVSVLLVTFCRLHAPRPKLILTPRLDAGGEQSPLLRQHPPPVSPEAPEAPEAPESPSWQQRPPRHDRRQLLLSSTSAAEDHRPSQMVSDAAHTLPSVPAPVVARLPAPIPTQRPSSLRRRPTRPGSAEDTGSGAE